MKVTGIECPLCGDQIWSKHRHDFRYCMCGACYVDGGREYLRMGYGGPKHADMPMPAQIQIEVSA